MSSFERQLRSLKGKQLKSISPFLKWNCFVAIRARTHSLGPLISPRGFAGDGDDMFADEVVKMRGPEKKNRAPSRMDGRTFPMESLFIIPKKSK
ncbi:MAG: hypothetical protein IJR97_13535 [Clostridia bacterium]|nr:hypothetical protein [Clostridia bacterium]